MFRLSGLVIAAALLAFGAGPAIAAEGEVLAAPGPALPDPYTVAGQRIDATAEAVVQARDAAMAQGRADAWTVIYRRFTAAAQWGKQPKLADNQLQRLVRSFEVSGERRSTTRYLADVTYHFNPAAVRLVLRQANVPYTETRSKPALVIPVIEDKRFDATSPWAMVWKDPIYAQGLVPLIPIKGDGEDLAALSGDLTMLDWAVLEPMAMRYDASEVVIAIASADGNTVQMIEITPMTRTAAALAFAESTFKADADAVAEKVTEGWKGRTSVDFGTRGRLTADVQFDSLGTWSRIRAQLRATRAVANVDVVGIAANEAEVSVSYFGRVEQLRDALAQQNLVLSGPAQGYSLQIARASAAASP